MQRKNVLVTSEVVGKRNLDRMDRVANVFASWKLDRGALEELLPDIDSLVVFSWPRFLGPENLSKMKRLRFIQSVLVGVNHVPFADLREDIVVSSNAGAYSLEVGEHVWGLLLAAAKKLVDHHTKIREGTKEFRAFAGAANDILVLKGRTFGIVGFGSIGRATARYAEGFGMRVIAFNRGRRHARGVVLRYGRRGLEAVLRQSDAVLLSLPLSRSTRGIIGRRELSMMKRRAVLVNVARGDLVDQRALYSHLKPNPEFRYATDVWWSREGRESLETDYPFLNLPNFIGTPHMSGPTGVASGRPADMAVENVLRHLRGGKPRNVVDGKEYVGLE